MKVDDGDQAFPTDKDTWDSGFGGMSLRDYYAGQAMQGILSSPSKFILNGKTISGDDHAENPISTAAYGIADAMISRKRETEK